MHPAARQRARMVARVFVASFACAFVGLALVGFVFGLLLLRLFGPASNLSFLVGAALCVAACASVAYWWATRPHPDRSATAKPPASDGDWPY